ncbi:3-dehydro-L-gulonate 2-dehydrogenase [Mangrovibacterium lignilyticum]|uniref:3-dehydro-L-gulonate 2-dehydrogenase n=1 Tax=Mangrovibacterium lignilyticum TaxID=2668052 RepID=UPI0013D6C288|nr:3-dehydro-L-gulonate 2-dehydrogenase [Mangrovibacterium lignilyticum]
MTTSAIYIQAAEMQQTFFDVLVREKVEPDVALKCAEIFTKNSLEGIYSHGVNRFSRFVRHIRKGYVKPQEKPSLIHSFGNIEQWDGNLGPGPLNALHAAARSMELARKSGMGLVSLANTNHWMRGGTYGLQCAEKGFAFIGWTNTIANLPPWGSAQSKLGNNPIVFAVPFRQDAILLDMALSQYSFGKLKEVSNFGGELPQPGGYSASGELTKSPNDILEGGRALPIGFWKGSALSLLLDILASILSGGLATHKITANGQEEYGVSQAFICIDLQKLANFPAIESTIEEIIQDYQSTESLSANKPVRYPGQNRKEIREKNLKHGIPVNRAVWERISSL